MWHSHELWTWWSMLKTNRWVVNRVLRLQSARCSLYHFIRSWEQRMNKKKAGSLTPQTSLLSGEKRCELGVSAFSFCVVFTNSQVSEFLQVLQVPKATAIWPRRAAKVIIIHFCAVPIHSFICQTTSYCTPCARHCIRYWIFKWTYGYSSIFIEL